MTAVLVVFESKYGQSSKIAEHIGEVSRRRGHVVRVLHVDNLRGVDVASFDAVAVVAPVYYSQHPRSILAFVRAHAAALAARRSAFFSVSNSAASRDPAVRRNARRVAYSCPTELAWHPEVVATAGGALAYPRYGLFVRLLMKRIAASTGEPTDVRRVHERTDWAQVDTDVATLLAPLEAPSEPDANEGDANDPSPLEPAAATA